jgi:hypothetical protein
MCPSDDHSSAMRAVAAEMVAAVVMPQPDLLGLPENPRVAVLRAERRAMAGRPPGARNKRSEDVARFIVEQIGDPLLMLAQLAVMPAAELAAAVGCTTAEALIEKRLAAIAVLPFVHQRQAVAIDVKTHREVSLTLVLGDVPQAVGNISGTVLDIELNQEDSDGDASAL